MWKRACSEAGRPKTLSNPGDRALADMVLVHSLAMNGGLLHAIDSLTEDECAAGRRAYRYFGLDAAADVLEDVARRWNDGRLSADDAELIECEADERYSEIVADDGVLTSAFEARYELEPSAFAPLS